MRRWLGTALALGTFVLLAWSERRRPLRRRVEPKLRREGRNLAVAGIGTAVLQLAGAPAIRPLTHVVATRRWGLLPHLRLPRWLEIGTALLLMDYTFFLWHVLTHRVPLLWRFHLVHHTDVDLDASTALRFHFGELLAGVPWQAAQVVLIGLTPAVYSVWQTVFLVSILFHHSALQMPVAWERCLSWFLVTPRMHGIHHSVVQNEADSNWSSGLNIWDRLHSTLRLDIPQTAVTIGVPAYRDPRSLRFPRLMVLPFDPLPASWEFPDRTRPPEHPKTGHPDLLLP